MTCGSEGGGIEGRFGCEWENIGIWNVGEITVGCCSLSFRSLSLGLYFRYYRG